MKIGSFTVRRWHIVAAAAVALVVALIVGVSGFASVRNHGVALEADLSAQYSQDQNELSRFILTVKEQIGVANLKTAKLDQVLSDAVRGRYDQGNGGSVQIGKGSALFSALVEAYPNLSGLDIFDKVAESIQAGRASFAAEQKVLLDKLRAYDTWRHRGVVHPVFVSWAGFPGPDLRAQIGRSAVHGERALAQMRVIVTTSASDRSFTSGNQEPIDLGTSK